jgi:pSer/pThr/pTyr-binding forkhead associated (FHA) protein
MFGKLVPSGGGPPIPLLISKLVVGRQRTCEIPLCYPTVSARHCELELLNGFWFVRDLGSRNGIRVNGHACTTEWLLPSDMLAISGHRYTVLYSPPAGQPPPQRLCVPNQSSEPPVPSSPLRFPEAPPAPRILPEARPVPPENERPADQQVWEPEMSATTLGKLMPCGGGPPIPLLRPRLIVGRHSGCDIVLRWAMVSGRHCELTWVNGTWSVRDLGSRNGTRVDGIRCESERLLPGSILWIGGLCFQIAYAQQEVPLSPKEET